MEPVRGLRSRAPGSPRTVASEQRSVHPGDQIAYLIEASSLGDPKAKLLRSLTPAALAHEIVDRAARLSRTSQKRPTHKARIPENRLLEEWLGGDQAACSELFERHYAAVVRFFHNKVSGSAQDDLVHETFLACLTSVSRFRGQANFKTFLFAIARNLLANYVRRLERGRVRLDSESDVDESPDTGRSLLEAAVQHQEQRILLEALRRVPRTYQVVLKLYYWDDLNTAEIGDLLRIPTATVKTRLRDGRVHLRKQYNELCRASEAQ